MTFRVFPIGYSTYGAQKYIDELMQDPKKLLIDTRHIPYSWRVDFREAELKAKYGERYRWAGKYLGNLAKDYGYIRFADIDKGIDGLMYYFDKGYELILLCGCSDYTRCHVRSIVDQLQQLLIIDVVRFGQSEQKMSEKELVEDAIVICQRTGKSKSSTRTWAKGDKVTASIPWAGDVAGIVRDVRMEGQSQQVQLRTAVYAPLLSKYIVSEDKRWFESGDLKERVSVIPELGEREETA